MAKLIDVRVVSGGPGYFAQILLQSRQQGFCENEKYPLVVTHPDTAGTPDIVLTRVLLKYEKD